MPWTRPSIQTIVDRLVHGLESRLFGNISLLRRAVLRILARVFAGAIHSNYGHVEAVTRDILFVSTALGEYLDNPHGRMWGVTRKPGTYAEGAVEFVGTDGAVIPKDTRLQNENGVEYGTIADGTIAGGIFQASIQAVEAGDAGNYSPSGAVTLQLISGISGVSNDAELIEACTGGTDREDDEIYRARILQRIQYPPMGGSEQDYVRWATEVSGVARAWCYPTAFGAGTVAVAITAAGDDPVPSSSLLSEVDTYITERKPVTAALSVESITDWYDNPGKVDMIINIAMTPNTADIQVQVTSNLEETFLPHRPGSTMPIAAIRKAISNAGAEDYSILSWTLDSDQTVPIDDIELTGFQYLWLQTAFFVDLT